MTKWGGGRRGGLPFIMSSSCHFIVKGTKKTSLFILRLHLVCVCGGGGDNLINYIHVFTWPQRKGTREKS